VGLNGFEPITVVITEDNHVDKIPEENFDKIITLVD
jgi:hypothetical protein